jgi:hypothetical protein
VNSLEIIADLRQQLACGIAKRAGVPPINPIDVSPWVASALMQKSIRRRREETALGAGATLLLSAPDRLWRRLCSICYEDIGVADINTVGLVTAAMGGKRVRAALGGEWATASFIISKMVQAQKCRAADDLLMSAERHPAYARARRKLATLSTPALLKIVIGSEDLCLRALSLWYGVGVHRPSAWLQQRPGEPQAVFDSLCEHGWPHTIVEIAREAYRKTRDPLSPLVSLLCAPRQIETAAIRDDDTPPEVMINGVPGWAYDRYSRPGGECLRAFLRGDTPTATWVRSHIQPAQRVDFIGDVLFRVEGQISRQRLHWPTADRLRHLVDLECGGHGCADASEIIALLKADIPALNDVRAELLGGQRHVQ